MNVLTTDRLTLRRLTTDDAPFIFSLVNDPAFLRFIGDKGVRTPDDAVRYIVDGPLTSYEKHGFGLLLVSLKADDAPIGICGVLKRDSLPDPDIGFAFLPAFCALGYANESASAVMRHAEHELALKRVLAITQPDNERSIRLLERLGMKSEQALRLADDAEDILVYARDFKRGQ